MATKLEVTRDVDGNITSIDLEGVVFVPEILTPDTIETPSIMVDIVNKEEEPEVIPVPEPAPVQHGPRPAAINNHRSTDAGCWFGGTSWSTKG